jgi:predicted transcriptional regulator
MTNEPDIEADEAIDAVTRRASVIECIVDGPKYNRDIRDELGVSRSTAYKAVSELEELGIARRGDEGYELTVLGQSLFEQYRDFHGRVTDICRSDSMLAALPRETTIPFEFLDSADISESQPHAPNRPVQKVEEIINAAEKIRGTGPVVLPRYVEIFAEQIVSDNLWAEIIYAEPVFEHLITVYQDDIMSTIESDNLEAWVTDSDLPFALLITDEPTKGAAMVIYDTEGTIKGVIANDTQEAYNWASEKWEQYRQSATKPSLEVNN